MNSGSRRWAVLLMTAAIGCGALAPRPPAEPAEVPGVVLLVRSLRHLEMALKTGEHLRSGSRVQAALVQIVVCDEAVQSLVDNAALAARIASANAVGVHTFACGLSMERFGVAPSALPAAVGQVPNGVIEVLRLQSIGYLSVEL